MRDELKRAFDSVLPINLNHDLPCVLKAQNRRYAYRILRLYRREQQLLQSDLSISLSGYRSQACQQRVERIKRENTVALQKLIDQYGWPEISRVGRKAARAAWLIVQHSDHDHLFQRRYLDFLKDAATADEADLRDLAYLTDRVFVAENRAQIYGTQVFDVRCKGILRRLTGQNLTAVVTCMDRTVCPLLPFQPLPIREPEHVDARRRQMGLPPLRDYIIEINDCQWATRDLTTKEHV